MSLKIVYLDDELELLDLFRSLFETEGIQLRTFSDPGTALVETELDPPDLIFLDYRLPQTTGDVIALMMDPMIPKVLITGDLSVRPLAPFVRVFHKPYSFQEMREFIANFRKLRSVS